MSSTHFHYVSQGETGPAVAYAGSESVLNDTDYMEYPDLQMFPAIGG